ncbi:hypothetical protein [Streptomyces sp. DSM 118878]
MRTTQICVRAGLAVAAAALPSALGTTAAVAAGDFTVTATGSTAQATRQAEPAEGSDSWRTVAAGARTVRVAGEDGTSPAWPTTSSTTAPTSMPTTSPLPTTAPTTAPARGVRGGLGGGSEDWGTPALAAGGTLVAAAVGTGLWYLRRRGARGRT